MRATFAATAAILLLSAGVAGAAGEVRQSGTSSQGRPVALVAKTDGVSRYVITWHAKCPGATTYSGSSDLSGIKLRPDDSFRSRVRYAHRVSGGRRAHVDVTVSGSLNPAHTRASGVFLGAAKIDGLGTCRAGRVDWKTQKSAD